MMAVCSVGNVDSKGIHGGEVLLLQTRISSRISSSVMPWARPTQDIVDRDAHSENTRLAVLLIWFDGDPRV